jgi:chemotaxis protein methyltransferase CheR
VNRLSDADFEALRDYLSGVAGLVFDESRRPGLATVVGERLTLSGFGDVASYLLYVRGPEGREERQRLLDDVTIQETHFFRNAPQIAALRDVILPDLMTQAADAGRSFTVWAAGCSTGEEPYTLAMLALEVREARGLPVDVRILGTDVSDSAIAVAQAATYAGRTVDLAEASARQRWFDTGPRGAAVVADEVRDLVEFQVHNLVSEPAPFADACVDLVVCRNVTIYFARETTRALVARFHHVLRPGGFLMLGHAETLWQVTDAFTLVPVGEAFAYRKSSVVRPGATVVGGAALLRRLTDREPAHANEPGRGRVRANETSPAGTESVPTQLAPVTDTRTRSSSAPAAPHRVVDSSWVLDAAKRALHEGKYAEAAELATRAASVDALNCDAYVVQGQALIALGDDTEALGVLRKAVYLDPFAGHAHFLLAGALSRLGQHEQSARAFNAAADSLTSVNEDALAMVLEGRDVDELVVMCIQLADAAQRATDVALAAGAGR